MIPRASIRSRLNLLPAVRDSAAWRDLNTPAFRALWFTQLLSGMLVAPLFTLFPIYVKEILGQDALLAAQLRSVLIAFGGLMALPGGALSDALGRKQTYLLGLTGTLAARGMFLTHDVRLLWALGIYTGVMFGVGTVGGQSYLMDSVPRGSLGIATAAYFMSGTFGSALGNLLGGRIADLDPRDGYGYLGGVILAGEAVLWGVAAFALPRLPRPEVPRTLRALFGGYGQVLRRRGVVALLALRYLPTFYWGAATLLMPLLIHRQAGTNRAAGDYSSLSLVVAAACQVVTGRWLDRRGSIPAVLTFTSLVTGSAALLSLSPFSLGAIYTFGILGAAAAWSLSISMPGLVSDLAPEEEKGRLLGATHLAWSAGFLSGSLVAGRYEATNPALPFQASAILCALAILAGLALRRGTASTRQRRTGLEEEPPMDADER